MGTEVVILSKKYLTQGVHIHVGQLCIFHTQFTIMC
jgi:hypothetical protein